MGRKGEKADEEESENKRKEDEKEEQEKEEECGKDNRGDKSGISMKQKGK